MYQLAEKLAQYHKDWAQHGICGRGVLLDLVRFYTDGGNKPLPYDPWTSYPIPAGDLEACAKQQGVTFKQGDILVLRVGFIQKWFAATKQDREALSARSETLYVWHGNWTLRFL